MTARIDSLMPRGRSTDQQDFLSSIRLDYGPIDLFSRIVLESAAFCAELGVTLRMGTFEDLASANRDNSDSWIPLFPVFDCSLSKIDRENAFCVLGENQAGQVVACHAARLYDMRATSFYEEATSLRLFYGDPLQQAGAGECCDVTARSTHAVTGAVVFSGAAWYRPDYRRNGLGGVFPCLGKVLAFSRWQSDFIVSGMTKSVHDRGFAPKFGYTNVDWEIVLRNDRYGELALAFLSMNGQDVIDYAERSDRSAVAKVDSRIFERRA